MHTRTNNFLSGSKILGIIYSLDTIKNLRLEAADRIRVSLMRGRQIPWVNTIAVLNAFQSNVLLGANPWLGSSKSIHLFNRYLLSAYYVPCSALGHEEPKMNQTQAILDLEGSNQTRETENKNTC